MQEVEIKHCFAQIHQKTKKATQALPIGLDRGHQTSAKNQIPTDKLRGLGMTFGVRVLLEQTIRQLVDAASS